jgi:hypothetical protein
MRLDPDLLRRLLDLVHVTKDEEIDCAEFLARSARYLDSLGPDGALPEGAEEFVHHMRVCPECCEEFEALLDALREESGDSA